MKRIVLLLLSIVFVGACQSYEAGIAVICDAPATCTECADVVPEDRARMLARHIEDQLSNGRAETLFDSLANMAPAERATVLESEAISAGLSSCPLSDWYRRPVETEPVEDI